MDPELPQFKMLSNQQGSFGEMARGFLGSDSILENSEIFCETLRSDISSQYQDNLRLLYKSSNDTSVKPKDITKGKIIDQECGLESHSV